MTTLLHIDASPSIHTSISRALSSAFLDAWEVKHGPATRVLRRDLALEQIACVDETWIAAAFTPSTDRTASQKQSLAQSDLFIQELKEADEYILGVPMYNFGIPASLKLWVDQVVRVGETYGFNGKERSGLLKNKKAHVFVASGGVYTPGSQNAAVNFVDPYLRAIFGYMGVDDVEIHSAGGTATIVRGQQTREEFLAPHLAEVSS